RFGSARHGRGWIGRFMLQGDFEGALKLALATPAREDRPGIKAAKKYIAAHWGKWQDCLGQVAHNAERAVLSHLASRPSDFQGALNRLPSRLLYVYLAAYQSFLWNETASECVTQSLPAGQRVSWPCGFGDFIFYTDLGAEHAVHFRDLMIPLLGHKSEIVDPAIRQIADNLLRREGISLPDFRLPRIKGAFFKAGQRRLIVQPTDATIGEPMPDEAYPGRFACTVRFTLPPGSYATIFVKRLQAGVGC
ncbi:MAG: tRNA pseudouridine(13) synthase TruD, partial [bacterium]